LDATKLDDGLGVDVEFLEAVAVARAIGVIFGV
jgi:hypothetical protein